jgi:hypothetical protein
MDAYRTGGFASEVAAIEDESTVGTELDTKSDCKVGVSGFTTRDASLASMLDLASGAIPLSGEGLIEVGFRSDVFRDTTERELAFGDILRATFFSTNRLFAPGRFCLALEDAVLPSKGLEITVLPGNCSVSGLS